MTALSAKPNPQNQPISAHNGTVMLFDRFSPSIRPSGGHVAVRQKTIRQFPMRTVLITLQAAFIAILAIYGAQSGAEDDRHCPLPLPQAEQSCER